MYNVQGQSVLYTTTLLKQLYERPGILLRLAAVSFCLSCL